MFSLLGTRLQSYFGLRIVKLTFIALSEATDQLLRNTTKQRYLYTVQVLSRIRAKVIALVELLKIPFRIY